MGSPTSRRNAYLVALTPIPRKDAHSVHHVKMTDAFAHLGFQSALVIPRYGGAEETPEAVFRIYGVPPLFEVHHLPAILLRPGSPWRRLRIEGASVFASFLTWFGMRAVRGRLKRGDIVVSTSRPVALAMALWARALPARVRPAVFYESHGFEGDAWYLRRLARWATAIVAISEGQKRHLLESGIRDERIRVLRNAVDDRLLETTYSQEEARQRMGFALEDRLAVYCGQVSPEKSVDVLAAAAEWLPEWKVVIAGWRGEDPGWLGPLRPSVKVMGPIPPAEVPILLAAADVLVIPYKSTSPYARASSPMKLFEYMAAGKPIVAARVPSVEEVVVGTDAVHFVEADNPRALAEGIRAMAGDSARAIQIGQHGREWAAQHTYRVRARRYAEMADAFSPR